MKSTLELITFLFLKKMEYCSKMGFKKNKYPTIVTDVKDLPDKSLKISVRATMRYDGECLGVWYPSTTKNPDLIYIDIGRHKTKKQLENTLVHELCHSKYKTMIHDKDFYAKIKTIIAGEIVA